MSDKLPIPFDQRVRDADRNHAADRAVLAAGSSLPAMSRQKYDGPTPSIRVLLIDGRDRTVKQIIMRMHPDDFRKILGKDTVQWARLGSIANTLNAAKGIEIMLAGDPGEQTVDPGHRWYEPEFEVADEHGRWGPVLHGRAAVFGFAPQLKKACSVPVNPIWLEPRVRWLDPAAARQRLEERQLGTALEEEPGQAGEAPRPGTEGLAALPRD